VFALVAPEPLVLQLGAEPDVPVPAREPELAMLEGSDGLCGCVPASADSPAESFLPNRHQLLPDPDWQPAVPIVAANRTAKRALVNRIARAFLQGGKESGGQARLPVALAQVLFPENEKEFPTDWPFVGTDEVECCQISKSVFRRSNWT
jgi:hypothetical protein